MTSPFNSQGKGVLRGWPQDGKGSPSGPPEHFTVLVVEDDAAVRRLIVSLMEGLADRVLSADNADTALRLLESHQGMVHVAISDVMMPGMWGTELARRLQTLRPETRVLLISAYHVEATARVAGTEFLQKPFSPMALMQKVTDLLPKDPGDATI